MKLKWLSVCDKVVNEVAASGGIYNCIECKKTYKTLGGLPCRNKAKHTENNIEGKRLLLDTVVLTDLLRKAAEIVSKDECWSQDTRGSVQDFVALLMGSSLKKSQSCVKHLLRTMTPKSFPNNFFCNITAKAIQFLNDLTHASATTIMMHLGKNVFSYLKIGEWLFK